MNKTGRIRQLEHANVTHIARNEKATAEKMLGIMKQLPREYTYRKSDLNKIIARADAAIGGGADIQKQLVASRSCPKGKKLKSSFKKLIMAKTNKKTAKIVRQTSGKHVSRDGLITRESIAIVVCSQEKRAGKKLCHQQPMGVYREKAPGGSWTSWAASVGIGSQINCKKMK